MENWVISTVFCPLLSCYWCRIPIWYVALLFQEPHLPRASAYGHKRKEPCMKARALTILLLLIFLLSIFAGCGRTAEPNSESESVETAEAPEVEPDIPSGGSAVSGRFCGSRS